MFVWKGLSDFRGGPFIYLLLGGKRGFVNAAFGEEPFRFVFCLLIIHFKF